MTYWGFMSPVRNDMMLRDPQFRWMTSGDCVSRHFDDVGNQTNRAKRAALVSRNVAETWRCKE